MRAATVADRALVATVLARAFIADPALGYIFPDPASRPRRLRRFFDLIVRGEADPGDWRIAGDAAGAGGVRPETPGGSVTPGQPATPGRPAMPGCPELPGQSAALGGGHLTDAAAVTIWRKPGAWRTPPSAMLGLLVPMLTTFGTALPRALRLQGRLEANHPAAPHWYLEFAGCDPARHGRGYGGAAIRAKLAEADAAGVPTALETANEGNIAIYSALGYHVTGDFAVTPTLKFWTMWREARR